MTKPLENRAEREKNVDALLALDCYGNTKSVAMDKFLDGSAAIERREKIYNTWESLRPRIAAQIVSSTELIKSLHAAGCPALPEDIGLDKKRYRHTMATAQLIRKRYTVLDFLYEAGVYDAALDKLCQ